MNSLLRRGLFSTIILAISACAPSSSGARSIDTLTGAAKHDSLVIEETVEQQAKNEISDSPTDFVVEIDEDRHAWDRARFFFEKYLSPSGDKAPVLTKIVGTRWALTSQPGSGSYVYEVSKSSVRNGFRYSVKCAPTRTGNHQVAVSNAQNLARFIKEGKLEVAQIIR